MFEKRRVQILFGLLFATIITLVIIFSTNSSKTTPAPALAKNFPAPAPIPETITNEWAMSGDNGMSARFSSPIPAQDILVAMCSSSLNETGYNESVKFCKCASDVVSCDFSGFNKSNKRTTAELGAFWSADTVKRICICGAPSNLQILLGQNFLQGFQEVNRVDIYNLNGPLIIDRAFSLHFAGDVYMSRVKFLRKMRAWEYGRGYTIALSDTTHLSCCSKIETPKFSSPTLFMEHGVVGVVDNSGINDQHLWKNLIFQNITFNKMVPYAIDLNWKEENASFTNCNFHNLEKTAIAVKDVRNLLVAHSIFHSTCNILPLGARSDGANSTVALISNEFLNTTRLEVDAKAVAIWFNLFSVWDRQTFRNLNATLHEDQRLVSIEFNQVMNFNLKSVDFPALRPKDHVVFNENLIIQCSCNLVNKLSLPLPLQSNTQRCFHQELTGSEQCHLNLSTVIEKCRRDSKASFEGSCSSGGGDSSKTFFSVRKIEEIEPFLKATSIHIESPFMDQMLKYIQSPFQIPTSRRSEEAGKQTPTPTGTKDKGTGKSSSKSSGSHFTLFSFLSPTCYLAIFMFSFH